MATNQPVSIWKRCRPECGKCPLKALNLCGWQPEEQERRIQRGLRRDKNGLWHYAPSPVPRVEVAE